MNWDSIGDTLLDVAGGGLPLIGGLIGGPVGATVGGLVASALGVDATPDAVEGALRNDPQALLKLKTLESNHEIELQRMTLAAETAAMAQVNETMRAELVSGDKFSKRWRPLFGYIMAVSFGAQMCAVTYQILVSPNDAANLVLALSGITWLWGIGLSVLGVQITKRSDDKARVLGQQPSGLVSRITNAVLPNSR